jgi:transcriptional regulator with XRE-family HTH domain
MARQRPVPSTLGERILLARVRAGLQQKEVADMADIAPNTLSQLEHGRQRQLSSSAVRRLARALGVSADYLLGLDLQETEVIDRLCHGEDAIPVK